MAYVGWATNVNKIILDSTTITVGEGATIQDSLETGGQKKSRLVSANPSDKFSVTMAFNCVEKDVDGDGKWVGDGLTEYERFMAWFKYQHCYGTNPFMFPAILINSNRQQGMSQEDVEHVINRIANGDTTAKLPDYEYYRITSTAEGSKSGLHQQVTMTWETYATGAFTIPDDISAINNITAENGCVDVVLTSAPSTEPTIDTWTLMITPPGGAEAQEQVLFCVFDGDLTAKLYFGKKTGTVGTYIARIGDFTASFTV